MSGPAETRTPEQILTEVGEALSQAWDMKCDSHGTAHCVGRDALLLIVDALYGPADPTDFEE